ncbi:MAG: hypothetical protein ACI38Q_04375 [Candidatus Bruticola sp.]
MSIASRTPIQVYPAILDAVKVHFRGFQEAFKFSTKDSLIFGFCRAKDKDCYEFVLIQAAKYKGCINAEVAVSPVKRYPYYRRNESLPLGTFAFRERCSLLVKNEDFSFGYGGVNLDRVLSICLGSYAVPALSRLYDSTRAEASMAGHVWDTYYADWQEAESKADFISTRRYPDLEHEEEANRFISQEVMGTNRYDRYLGPLKLCYQDSDFFNCHVYLMASAMEFVEPPPMPEKEVQTASEVSGSDGPKVITWRDILGPVEPVVKAAPKPMLRANEERREPLEDPIMGVLGRQEQSACIELNCEDARARLREYAFLKSMSALEVIMNRNS